MTADPTAPEISPARIFQVANGFCTAKIVLTALRTGLFGELSGGPATEPELRDRLGLHPRGSWHFLNALVWLGMLERDGDRYRNSPAADRYLVADRPTYMGGFLDRADTIFYPAWGRFDAALRTGRPVVDGADDDPYEHMSADPAQLRSFLGMMDAMNGPLGPELAASFDWSPYATVVDIGGARGNLVANIAGAHPHLSAGVFDRPRVEPAFDEHMAALGLTERVRFHPGDFFTDPLPEADVLILGHVLHDWAAEERRALVRKAYDSVRPGGALLVYDPMVDDELRHPMNLVISLDLLLTTHGGAEYPAADCRAWMIEAGFTDVTSQSLGYNDTLVVARKGR